MSLGLIMVWTRCTAEVIGVPREGNALVWMAGPRVRSCFPGLLKRMGQRLGCFEIFRCRCAAVQLCIAAHFAYAERISSSNVLTENDSFDDRGRLISSIYVVFSVGIYSLV